MQLVAHPALQGLVDHLVLLHPALALERGRDDVRGIVVAVPAQILDPLLTLLDAALTPLISDDDSGSGQDARIERYTLPATGLYYIRAQRFAGSPLPTRGGYILVLAKLAN